MKVGLTSEYRAQLPANSEINTDPVFTPLCDTDPEQGGRP